MKSSHRTAWLSLVLLATLSVFTACSTKPTPTPIPTVPLPTEKPASSPTALPAVVPTATSQPMVVPTATKAPTPTLSPTGDGTTLSANLFLDPALAQDADSLMVSQYIYSGLFQIGDSGQPEPALVESWVVSEDQLDYIFKLRSSAVFSNGKPITADVVKDNFDRWFDPNHPLHGNGDFAAWKSAFLGFLGEKDENKHALSTVDGIEKVDQLTVLIHLNRPVPELLTYLANPAFAILDPVELKAGKYNVSEGQLVTCGPYKIGSWTKDTLTLVPDPTFWGTVPQGELTFKLK
jgi:ABC-type transport system substrate-binding protein